MTATMNPTTNNLPATTAAENPSGRLSPPTSASPRRGPAHQGPHSPIRQRPLSTYTTLGSPLHHRQAGALASSRLRGGVGGHSPLGWRGHPTARPAVDGLPLVQGALVTPTFQSLEPAVTQKAMETAAAAERSRAKKLEEDEVNMTADELRAVLKRERHRTGRIQADFAALKATAVQSQLEAEVVEEGRINGLMRRLDNIQQEKGRIVVELEREEELLTNTLQKKLNEVRAEKAALEHQIEREKKAHLILQTQLSDIRNNHLPVAEALEDEDEMEEEL